MRIRTIAFICIAVCLRAQDPPATAGTAVDLRGPAIGEVRDANGKPWVGAEVVLISRPLPHDANTGELDRVVANVDERGRFRANILRGRPYTAWAWGEASANGRPASAVADRVFVQQPIVLQQERVLPVRDVVLARRERWDGFAFRVRVVDETWNRDVHWLDVGDGPARLPWLVGPSAQVELFAVRDGVLNPLASEHVDHTAAAVRIEVPEHQRVTCFAYDDGDAPLADAPIFRSLGDAMHRAGTTDARGRLAIDFVAGAQHARSTFVLADTGAMGVFARVGDLQHRPDLVIAIPASATPDDLLCRLRRSDARVVHATFFGDAGKPLADLEVWHSGTATNNPTRQSGQHAPWSRTSRTDANGTIRLPARQGWVVAAHLLLGERALARLPAAWRAGLSPIVYAPLGAARGTGTKDDPLVVTLAQLCPVELTFVGPGRTTVAGVEVALAALEPGKLVSWPQRAGSGAFTDERGRIRLLVPAAQHLGLSAKSGLRMLIRAFETTPGCVAAGPATATFELPAPAGIRGRLVDPAGAAVSDRRLTAIASGEASPQWQYDGEPASVLTVPGNALRVLFPEDPKELLTLSYLISAQEVATDAEGRFNLPLPPVAIPGLRVFNFRQGDLVVHDSCTVDCRGEVQELEWTIRR